MTIDIDMAMVENTVYISVNDGDWTLSRQSHTIGEIFCEDEYIFVEDHTIGGYTAFAPLVGETGVRSTGRTRDEARENIEVAISKYVDEPDTTPPTLSGHLAFATPDDLD